MKVLAGDRARVARMDARARSARARRACTARWIRDRFGAPGFAALGLAGGELVDVGLRDLAEGRPTAESFAVSLAAPRLRREGVPLTTVDADPEDRLHELLSRKAPDLAHGGYNAYLVQLASFADALRSVRCRGARRAW